MTLETLFGLTGRRALITGSSRGIGFALAEGLASVGAEVVLNGRNPATLAEAAAKLRAAGATVGESVFDVTDHAESKRAVDAIESEIGALDILVNNAGMTYRESLEDYPVEVFQTLMRTNLDSVFNVGQAAARHMIERGHGKIVNVCSVQTLLARPGTAPYVASKGAVANLTKGMCTDWARHGLQVNALAPGYFKTDLTEPLVEDETFTHWLEQRTPAGRWGDVSELVGACVFLCAPSSGFVNGHILYVDGGITSCL